MKPLQARSFNQFVEETGITDRNEALNGWQQEAIAARLAIASAVDITTEDLHVYGLNAAVKIQIID